MAQLVLQAQLPPHSSSAHILCCSCSRSAAWVRPVEQRCTDVAATQFDPSIGVQCSEHLGASCQHLCTAITHRPPLTAPSLFTQLPTPFTPNSSSPWQRIRQISCLLDSAAWLARRMLQLLASKMAARSDSYRRENASKKQMTRREATKADTAEMAANWTRKLSIRVLSLQQIDRSWAWRRKKSRQPRKYISNVSRERALFVLSIILSHCQFISRSCLLSEAFWRECCCRKSSGSVLSASPRLVTLASNPFAAN